MHGSARNFPLNCVEKSVDAELIKLLKLGQLINGLLGALITVWVGPCVDVR